MKYHYTSLKVFHTADEFVSKVFDITKRFPSSQRFVVTSQLRRAALSVVLNIVEGNARRLSSDKEFVRFLKIALGSLAESDYLIYFANKNGYINQVDFETILAIKDKCGAQLWKLI